MTAGGMMNHKCKRFYLVLILLLFMQISYAKAPKCNVEKFKQYQMEYCLYTGSGPLLVLEGSQGNSMAIWPQSFLRDLNRFSEILIYNRIGYGQSRIDNAQQLQLVTAKSVSTHLHALLKRLNIHKRIIIIAHSIGGIYAQYYVRNYPENIAGLVMIDADSSFEPKINSPFQSKMPDKVDSMGYFESQGFNESMDQVNSSPRFPDIPLLVITATNHGSNNKTEKLWQELQKNIAKQSPQGRQIIANGSGHFVFEDSPALVVAAIDHFIRANKLS